MREQAHLIQAEVRRLLEDIGRLRERTSRLTTHLRQVNEDVESLDTSMRKIATRGDRILQLEFEEGNVEKSAREDDGAALAFGAARAV